MWSKGIPKEDGYYWMYGEDYDILEIARVLGGKVDFFPKEGLVNVERDGPDTWWKPVGDTELPI